MKLSVGIVGLPNVGKSTLFKALTNNPIDIANYPFCTIDPNVGVVEVPDERVDKLSKLYNPKKTIPAVVEFVDIAGLVKGASKGEGLGNQFLSHIREVTAVIHLVRGFLDSEVTHVDGSIDPLRDLEIIKTELELKDLESSEEENLLSKKPVITVLNASLEEVELYDFKPDLVLDLSKEVDLGKLIKDAYELLGLISFFTVGEDEVRSWTVKKGSTAPEAGAAIHSDFLDKFIKAEVVGWDKLLEAGGKPQAAAKGWLRTEGKDYVVCDGDVVEFKHGG